MKNLLALVGAVVVLVGGLGWYLGWYKLTATPDGSGHISLKGDVDTNKFRESLKKAEHYFDENGKKVEGTPTSRPVEPPPGGWTLPDLPKLPTPPGTTPIERNPDGTLKISIDIPPPPTFPGNK